MKEDFLHYLWDAGKIPSGALRTTGGLPVMIRDKGMGNTDAGPDFLHATVYIGDTLWSGHVEMHLNASSWYDHKHHRDPAYRNVILHVVWRNDRKVFLPDGSELPVIELQGEIPRHFLRSYSRLSEVNGRFLNCSGQFGEFRDEQWYSWLSELFLRRMTQRAEAMFRLDRGLRGHWEELLLRSVFRYMGARVNATSFNSIASAVGIDRVRKIVAAGEDLEVVLHGLAGFLDYPEGDPEIVRRQKEYRYLCSKYGFVPERVVRPVFFRLRPAGFPTIRLSQLAGIYSAGQGLFATLLKCESPAAMRKVFEVEASSFWDSRYTYRSVQHTPVKRKLSVRRIDLLLLNAVFPVLYTYYRSRGSEKMHRIIGWASAMPAEHNKVLEQLKGEGIPLRHAADAQGALELYKHYCSKNSCLQCHVGRFIIGG